MNELVKNESGLLESPVNMNWTEKSVKELAHIYLLPLLNTSQVGVYDLKSPDPILIHYLPILTLLIPSESAGHFPFRSVSLSLHTELIITSWSVFHLLTQ
jgi:hypothetical protein